MIRIIFFYSVYSYLLLYETTLVRRALITATQFITNAVIIVMNYFFCNFDMNKLLLFKVTKSLNIKVIADVTCIKI